MGRFRILVTRTLYLVGAVMEISNRKWRWLTISGCIQDDHVNQIQIRNEGVK
jgi:hypothetical protein